jgi:hypothetical protein
MPLALAFNIFVRRCRAPTLWLVAGNLTVLAGILGMFYSPDLRQDMAAIRAAGFAQLSGPMSQWNEADRTLRHAKLWSRGSADLNVETWPRSSQSLLVDFSLYSLAPRSVNISQDGQELWRGEVGPIYTHAQFLCRLSDGSAHLRMATDAAAVPEGPGLGTRSLAFAVCDPILAVQDRIDSKLPEP